MNSIFIFSLIYFSWPILLKIKRLEQISSVFHKINSSFFNKTVSSDRIQSSLCRLTQGLYQVLVKFFKAIIDSCSQLIQIFCFPAIFVNMAFQTTPKIFNASTFWYIGRIFRFGNKFNIIGS